jgi:Ras GTPase-activating-like protein IQGAP2/3
LVKERYVENLKALQLYSRKFVVAIISSFETLPYAIRFTLAQIFKMIPQNRLVGHFVFYRYINPAIVSPETFDVLERPIGAIDRKNLAELSRILQFVVLNKQFTFEDYSHLIPLNDFVLQSHKAYYGFIDKLIQIEDLETHFGLVPKGEEPTGSNVIVVESDYVYMSMFQIYKIHEAVTTWCTSLKEITATLGPAPKSFQDDHSSIRIDLMKPRNFTVYSLDGHSTLLLVVKKYLIVVLGFYEADFDAESMRTVEDLLSLSPSAQQEEAFLVKFPCSEDFQSIDSSPSSAQNSASADYLASLATLQRSLLGDISKLEGFCCITHTDGFNGVLVALAQDLQSRSSKSRVLARDLKSAYLTMHHLDEKSQYLGGRIQAINDYVKNAIQVLTSNAKIKKPLPFTKHYSHLKALERQGKLPRYGSFKYTAAELYSRGIIYSIAEYSVNQYDKISITISSNDPGVWVMEATLMGIKIPQSATLKLEDLLDSQFNNQPKMTLFGGIAKVNVNLLLHFLNRKFFE